MGKRARQALASHLQPLPRCAAVPNPCAVPVSGPMWRAVIDAGWVSSQISQRSRAVPLALCSCAGLARQGEGERLGLWLHDAGKLHVRSLAVVMAALTFIPAHLLCPAGLPRGMMFQQEEATDTQLEQGSHHTSKAATVACSASPAPGEPGLRSDGPQAQLAAKLGLHPGAMQRDLSAPLQAELKHTSWAKACWGAGACRCLSWLQMEEARDLVHLQLVRH